MAAVCRMTYDVDEEDIHWILTPAEIGPAIDCAIIIHENTPKSTLSVLDNSLFCRNKRLSHRLEKILRNHVIDYVAGRTAINNCISNAWAAYVSTRPWQALTGDNSRWITTVCGPTF